MNKTQPPQKDRAAFTLVELLVSISVLSILLLVIVTALDSIQRSWKRTKEKVDQFREARVAFENITRQLSQATLNPYWDYYYAETNSNLPPEEGLATPAAYVRHSELHFICDRADVLLQGTGARRSSGHALFFQAPLGQSRQYRGLGNLLNGHGYYVQWNEDDDRRPKFLPASVAPVKKRYQLMEYRPISEAATTEDGTVKGNTIYLNPERWYLDDLTIQSRAIASNILTILFSPQVAKVQNKDDTREPWWIAPNYRYDSRDPDNSSPAHDSVFVAASGQAQQGTQHLLPPAVRVTLVAADEVSMERWLRDQPDAGGDLLAKAGAPFANAANYEADLAALKKYLDSQRLTYRVFSSTVPLRNAQWDNRLTPDSPSL
jgi:uncharacterized protein (TIGR02599 family)